MFPRDEKTEELLSSFLDGELSAENAAEAQRLLSDNPELSRHFEKIKRIQNSLRSIPGKRLDSGFSERVLEQARLRALSMGNFAPPWIDSKVVARPLKSTNHRAIWVGIALLAASLSAIAIFYRPDSNSLGLLDEILVKNEKLNDSSHLPLNGDELLNAKLPGTNPLSPNATNAAPLAQADPTPSQPSVEGPANTKGLPFDNLAQGPSNKTPKEVPSSNMVNGQGVPKTSDSDEEILKAINESIKSGVKSRFLLVVDVSVSKQAWENGTFNDILNEYDVPFESLVAITDEIKRDLSESRLVDGKKGELEKVPGVALVFVKARAEQLDRIIQSTYQLYNDFPEFSFDMSVDLACQKTLAGLEKIEFFQDWEASESKTNGVARSLSADANSSEIDKRGLIQFKASPRRVATAPMSGRKEANARPMIQASDMNPVEYCLFVLRPEVQ